MKTRWLLLVPLAALLSFCSLKMLRAEDEPGRRDPFPDDLAAILRQTFPDAEIVRARREDRDDSEYDVKLRNKKTGLELDVEISAHAGVKEVDEDLGRDGLPPHILASVEKAFPQAAIREARKKTEIRVSYEVEVATEGRRRVVTLSPKGRVLEVERRR